MEKLSPVSKRHCVQRERRALQETGEAVWHAYAGCLCALALPQGLMREAWVVLYYIACHPQADRGPLTKVNTKYIVLQLEQLGINLLSLHKENAPSGSLSPEF